MIDNFEYTYLPKGKVIICACDQVYFEIFFYKLYTSFTKNISEFNQLHIHLINPDINLINSIKKGNTKSNVSFSWEGEAQISLIKKLKININDWEKILPIKIKKTLLAHSFSGLPYVQFLYQKIILRNHFLKLIMQVGALHFQKNCSLKLLIFYLLI